MNNIISTEYAEALFMLACEEHFEEKCREDLQIIKEIIESESEYISYLASPSITKEEKLSAIKASFGERVHMHVESFLMLLCEKNRIELLSDCINEFEKLYNALRKVSIAQVISAIPLTETEKQKISSQLEKRLGHKIELNCAVDESIMGGIIIKTEDSIIDGSLKHKIQEVKEVICGESKT